MKYKDMKGQTFGSLTVIQKSTRTNAKQQVYWICECHCGRLLEVRGDALRNGISTQCSICHIGRGGKLSRFVQKGEKHG